MRLEYSQELEDYRAEVRAFIAEHGPGPRKHVGVRAPAPELIVALWLNSGADFVPRKRSFASGAKLQGPGFA